MDVVNLDAVTGAVTGWPLVAVVLSYAVCPYAVLWLAVRLWPRGHPRRAELLAEYASVDWWMRPLWVGDVAIRCLLDGLSVRFRRRWTTVDPQRRFLWRMSVAAALVGAGFVTLDLFNPVPWVLKAAFAASFACEVAGLLILGWRLRRRSASER